MPDKRDSHAKSRPKRMGRPPFADYWRAEVWHRQFRASPPHTERPPTIQEIADGLEKLDPVGAPGARTVQRWLQEFKGWPQAERDQWQPVRWPEVCLAGILPWEASSAVLDLLHYDFEGASGRRLFAESWTRMWKALGTPDVQDDSDVIPLGLRHRPDVREARWFWYVTQARSDESIAQRALLASRLAQWEREGCRDDQLARSIEGFLVYTPWRPGHFERYKAAATEDGLVPPIAARDLVSRKEAPNG